MSDTTADKAHDDHGIPLWGLFLALLAFTAAEVGLYEVWRQSAMDGNPFLPKVVLVLIIFAFTIPKGAIVMIYFMHLKFEKSFVVALSIAPFVFAAICILTPLVDGNAVAENMDYRSKVIIKGHAGHADDHGDGDGHNGTAAPKDDGDDEPDEDEGASGSNEDN